MSMQLVYCHAHACTAAVPEVGGPHQTCLFVVCSCASTHSYTCVHFLWSGRLWDCRTGRSIWTMEGHIKQVLALDFSPDGYHVVTGSDDHQAKVRGVGMFYHI